ncbi:MAG: ATP-dependent exonuclease [Flavobacteriales bacterium]|nr:MAG: ATP-dependent exonuclease [Flavobacteriales bacterium]
MKRLFTLILAFSLTIMNAQSFNNIKDGEYLKYRIHYGFFNAGYAQIKAKKTTYKGKPHLHIVGTGRSTGAVETFFKVRDRYETFIDAKTGLPSYYIRDVKEGNYTQHLETEFYHHNNVLRLMDKEKNETKGKLIKFPKAMQDMLSAFYYLRSTKPELLRKGYKKNLNVWIDNERFPFQLRVAGKKRIKTKFGKIEAIRIIPLVKSGRVFKDKEGVELWVSNDKNLIPLSVRAKLVVGSLKADLEDYKNVKYPLNFH